MSKDIGLFTEDICPNCGTDLVRDEEGVFMPCPCRPKVHNRVVGAGRPKPRPPAVDQPLAESNAPLNLINIYDAGHVPHASQTQADFYGDAHVSHPIQSHGNLYRDANVLLAQTGSGPPQMPTSSYGEAYMINQSRNPANIYGETYMANQLRAPASDDGYVRYIPRTATNTYEDSFRANIAPIPTNTYDSAHEANRPPIYNDPRGAIPRTPHNAYRRGHSAHEHSHHTNEYKEGGASHRASGNTYQALAQLLNVNFLGNNYTVPPPTIDPRAILPAPYQQQGASQPSDYRHHKQQGNAHKGSSKGTYKKPKHLPEMKPEESMALNGFMAALEFGLNTPNSSLMNVSDSVLNLPINAVNAQTSYAYLIPMHLVNNAVLNPGHRNRLYYANFMNPPPGYQNNVVLAPNYGYNMPLNYNTPLSYIPVNYGNNFPVTPANFAVMNVLPTINYQHYANNEGNIVVQNLDFGIEPPLLQYGAPAMGFGNQVNLPEEDGALGGVPQYQLGPLPENPQPPDEVRIRSRKQRTPKRYVRNQQITENMQAVMRAFLFGDLPVQLCPQAPAIHCHHPLQLTGSPRRYNGLL